MEDGTRVGAELTHVPNEKNGSSYRWVGGVGGCETRLCREREDVGS